MTINSSHLEQALDILDVLTLRVDSLTLSELYVLEDAMSSALQEGVSEAIIKQQIHTVFEGYAVDPMLPDNFSVIPNEDRPPSHMLWWCRPYIVTRGTIENKCYWVECLDGGAWDRPTFWGESRTLKGAAEICRTGRSWTNPPIKP